jgi:hypothetical protein
MILRVLDRTKQAEAEFARLKRLDAKHAEREPGIRKLAEEAKEEYVKLKKHGDPSAVLKKLQLPGGSDK